MCDASRFVLLFQDNLDYSGSLWFYTNFRIFFFYFCKKFLWNLDRDYINFVEYEQFNINFSDLHRISFHLFVSYPVSFVSVLHFSVYRSFTSLVKFIHKYFIFFDAIVNGVIIFISFFRKFVVSVSNANDFVS